MRPEPNIRIEQYRRIHPVLGDSPAGANVGYFEVQVPAGGLCRVIASDGTDEIGQGWEHVSVSLPGRCPNWHEMAFIKDLFWCEDETVLQFHPKRSAYVNTHRYCLHLWRKSGADVELPPRILIG